MNDAKPKRFDRIEGYMREDESGPYMLVGTHQAIVLFISFMIGLCL